MATWPDIGETRDYVGEVKDDQMPILEQCLDAAILYIEFRTDGNITEDDDYVDIVPENVRLATLQLAAREFRRRLSPGGVEGFGDFGAVRITRVDPDIELLIVPQRSWGFA